MSLVFLEPKARLLLCVNNGGDGVNVCVNDPGVNGMFVKSDPFHFTFWVSSNAKLFPRQ